MLTDAGVNASIHEAVLKSTSTGFLTLLYQETNTGADPLTSLSMANFSNTTTSVNYLTDSGPAGAGFVTGSMTALSETRNGGVGPLVSFVYSGVLNPANVGDILVVSTNAINYNFAGSLSTSSSITGDGNAVVSDVLQPSAVPEPNSMILLGSAAAVLGLVSRVRRRKTA